MAARKKTIPSPAEPSLSFEEAMDQLENVVETMEQEQLPLEDLVAHYEKGSRLLRQCEAVLKNARERLELITLKNQTENALDSDTSPIHGEISPSDTTDDDPDDDDDIRLF